MRSIWAVATNTIKQAVRMKIAAVFIVLLIVLLPVMGAAMTGDGTLKGKLQTFKLRYFPHQLVAVFAHHNSLNLFVNK